MYLYIIENIKLGILTFTIFCYSSTLTMFNPTKKIYIRKKSYIKSSPPHTRFFFSLLPTFSVKFKTISVIIDDVLLDTLQVEAYSFWNWPHLENSGICFFWLCFKISMDKFSDWQIQMPVRLFFHCRLCPGTHNRMTSITNVRKAFQTLFYGKSQIESRLLLYTLTWSRQ